MPINKRWYGIKSVLGAKKKVTKENKALQHWVGEITVQDMPVFGHTVQSVVSMSKDDSSTVSELTQVILQDSSMTARILKLSNTIFYNPNVKSISTVSRAIVVLGLEAVCNICLTIKLIDTLMKSSSHDRLVQEMGLSIHAAVQARNIAKERGDKEPEEVFVAALLMRLGRMAFWCYSNEESEKLSEALAASTEDPEKIEEEILGFPLKDLTKSLVKEWGLGELMQAVLNDPEGGGPRVRNVVVSDELVKAVENGWDSEEMGLVTEEVADLLGQPVEAVTTILHDGAKDAAMIACSYGASAAAKVIPLPVEFKKEVKIEEEQDLALAEVEFPPADPRLQLAILKEIKGLIDESPSFNALLEMVMEGIYRGTGMDRTLFALMSPDHKFLKAKYALGHEREQLTSDFYFPLSKAEPNIFLFTLIKQQCLWVEIDKEDALSMLAIPSIKKVLGDGDFLVAPLIVNDKPIGVIYADRIPSGRELDGDIVKSFEHFSAQANIGLARISSSRGGKS